MRHKQGCYDRSVTSESEFYRYIELFVIHYFKSYRKHENIYKKSCSQEKYLL